MGGEQIVKQIGLQTITNWARASPSRACDFRGEHVLYGMSQFAEILVTAGSGVSLEGVNAAPQVADQSFGIAAASSSAAEHPLY